MNLKLKPCGKKASYRKVEPTLGGNKPFYYCVECAPNDALLFDGGKFVYKCDRGVEYGLHIR